MKELPQRILALELRTAIDRAMARPGARWKFQVWWLIENNPRGAASSHVAHNLGAARRAWLARLATMLTDPRSLEEDMVRKHDIEPTKKTEGGPVKPQGEYKVGEKGEEVFIPIPKTIRGDAVPEKKG